MPAARIAMLDALIGLLLAGAGAGAAQSPPGRADSGQAPLSPEARAGLVGRLRQLELPFTDWTLLLDVGEKIAGLGAAARPPVAVEIEMARGNADPRYRVRLLGVQMRIDPDAAFEELQKIAVGGDENLAALAARVLGRSAPNRRRMAALVRERLAQESRSTVRSALVLAAGEAGVGELASLLRVMIEKGAFSGQELVWAWTAFAQCADGAQVEPARLWLTPHSQFLGAAVLLARRFRDSEAERPLLRLLETEQAQPVSAWIAHSLGAIGDDLARRALREAIDADEKARKGALVVTPDLDARQLALLRLGDKDARVWAVGQVARAATLLASGVGRLPELFGKWRVDGAADQLVEWCARPELPMVARASAARGLCWLRDGRGVAAAADLLADAGDVHEPAAVDGVRLAQQTLHEFVADLDRPDYRGLVAGDRDKAESIGKAWRAWLQDRHRAATWRRPPEDSEDLLSWF